MKYIIFLILILILVSLFIYINIQIIEGYDKWDIKIFNMNWNKPWKEIEVSYNDSYPQDIPRSSNNDDNFPNYILEIFKEKYMKSVLEKMTNKNLMIDGIVPINLLWTDKFKINRDTWYNRINDFNIYNALNYEDNQQAFSLSKSCLPQVNIALEYFISEFNNIFKNTYHEKIFNPFSILKFKIHKINRKLSNNNNCIYEYGIIIVLVRDEGHVGPTIYLNFIVQGDKIDINYYDLIGYYTNDKLYLPEGVRTVGKKEYYELNPLYRNNKSDRSLNADITDKNWQYLDVNYNNSNQILWRQKQSHFDNTLKDQYTCFNAEPHNYNPSGIPPTSPESDSQPILNYVYNKNNCEAKYDHYGRPKPKGVWDRPCISDTECKFYGKNVNYPNKFGKCNKENGFCELPRGMKNLSYHNYYPYDNNEKHCQQFNPKPLCYNCSTVNRTDKWKPVTLLDDCCEDQKDSGKYPHLDGPDYAYRGDTMDRINSNR
jgi:hypothetical protein